MKIFSRWIVCLLGLSLFPAVFSACDDGQEEFPGDSVLRKKEIYDPGCTGKPSYCRLYYYDEKGDFLWASFDHNCNDIRDEQEHCCESSTGWDEVVEMNWAYEDFYSNPDPFRFTDLLPASEENPDPWEYDLPSVDTDERSFAVIEADGELSVLPNYNYSDCIVYAKDENGFIIFRGYDDDCDGTYDSDCVRWTYNDDGRVSRKTMDTNCDGESDKYCCEWSYNEFNQPTEYGCSVDCDGTRNWSCKVWRYDEEGRQTYYSRDTLCSGNADVDCTEWTYDHNGNLIEITYGKDCNRHLTLEIPRCEVWKRTDDGKFLGYYKDLYCDGKDRSTCRTLSYDEKGRIVEYRREEACDGVGDVCKTYTYKEKYEEKQ